MNTLKRITAASLALMISLGCWSPATAESFPETIPLPNGFQPEGISLGNGHIAYVGSLADGSIYQADLRTGAGSLLVQGSLGYMPMLAVGLDFDESSGYLFVAGGIYGDGRVYDTKSGELVTQLSLGAAGYSWINDVVVTRDAAYFTDSFAVSSFFAPQVYKVALDSHGAPIIGTVQPLALGGDWFDFGPPPSGELVIYANGIVATPDDGALIIVNSASGRLYRVDPETGVASDLGADAPMGDGLVLRGKTLYVVQNFLNQVSVFTLSPDYSAATHTHTVTSGDFDTPSTADLFGPWLYVVNARFLDCFPLEYCPPDTQFNIVRVDQ